MKLSDIKPGVVYYWDPSNKWRENTGLSSMGFVVFDKVSADWSSGGVYRPSYHEVAEDRGDLLRGRSVDEQGTGLGDPKWVYVRPAQVRATAEEAKQAVALHQAARERERQDFEEKQAAADERAESLRTRLLKAGVEIGHGAGQVFVRVDYRTSTVKVDMSGQTLAALLDKFGA